MRICKRCDGLHKSHRCPVIVRVPAGFYITAYCGLWAALAYVGFIF